MDIIAIALLSPLNTLIYQPLDIIIIQTITIIIINHDIPIIYT